VVVSAQVAVYPLRQVRLSPAIQAVADALAAAGLESHVGPMSTLVTGEVGGLFAALQAAFVAAAEHGPVVLTLTLSNACPVPEPPAAPRG
jgi:uncharacterized protein YqgV (UPF0045/DUF77 family)